jgi:hypothetical protein
MGQTFPKSEAAEKGADLGEMTKDIGILGGAVVCYLLTLFFAGALGLEWQLGEGFVFGFGVGMQDGKSDSSNGANVSYKGKSLTSYLMGRSDIFFGSLTVTAGRQDFDSIQSAGPYGSTPFGQTEGSSMSAELVVGATVAEFDGWAVIPILGVARTTSNLDAYTEAGVGGIAYSAQELNANTASASVELAKERGAFPLFNADLYLSGGNFASRLPQAIKDQIRKYGIRNSHLLSIAPTGTISLAFADNASNGIEPAFSWTYTRKKREPDGNFKTYAVEDHAWRLYRHLAARDQRHHHVVEAPPAEPVERPPRCA